MPEQLDIWNATGDAQASSSFLLKIAIGTITLASNTFSALCDFSVWSKYNFGSPQKALSIWQNAHTLATTVNAVFSEATEHRSTTVYVHVRVLLEKDMIISAEYQERVCFPSS